MIKLSPQGYRKEQLRVLDPTSIQIGETVYAVHDTGSDELLQQGKYMLMSLPSMIRKLLERWMPLIFK